MLLRAKLLCAVALTQGCAAAQAPVQERGGAPLVEEASPAPAEPAAAVTRAASERPAAGSEDADERRVREAAAERRPGRRALLVGCTEYPYLRERYPRQYGEKIRLNGSVNDVELVRQVLVESLGFDRGEVRSLAGWPDDERARPTRERILDELADLASRSGEGDLVVVYFAGHGTQQPSRSASEPDGLDEVLLPADVRSFDAGSGAIPGAIRDDELGAALRAIRDAGARVWCVVDACHSGSVLRGDDASAVGTIRMRGLERSLIGVEATNAPRFRRQREAEAPVDDGEAADFDGIVAFYGAQSYGRAPETVIDVGGEQRWHGLFTWLLAQELVRTRGLVSYEQLIGRVVAAYQAWPYAGTIPGALGPDRERRLLDGADADDAWLVRRTGNAFELDRGLLAGLEVGAVVELLADDGTALTTFEVSRAEPFRSFGTPAEPDRLDGGTSWSARLLSRPNEGVRLEWSIVDRSGAPLALEVLPEAVRARLAEPSVADRYPFVPPERAEWLLVVDGDRHRLRPAAGREGHDLFLDGLARLPQDLAAIARTQNLVALASQVGVAELPPGLTVRVEVREGERGAPRTLRPGERVPPGQQLRVLVEKERGPIFDLNLFYADSHFGLTRIFPGRGDSARLGAEVVGEQEVLGWTWVLDTSIGVEHVLVIAQQRRESDPVLDLARLEQDQVSTLRSAAQDPVAAFLEDLARAEPTRSIGRATSGAPLAVVLTTAEVDWRAIGAPAWPSAGAVDNDPPAAVPSFEPPPGVPSPFDLGPRLALTTLEPRPLRTWQPEVLLGGDERVRRVLVDVSERRDHPDVEPSRLLDPRDALASGRFVPDAAFVLADDGRYAFYRGRGSDGFDTVLVDLDGDGLADASWRRGAGTWVHEAPLAVPWLSQAWLGALPNRSARVRAMRTLGVLAQAPDRP